MVAAVGDPLYPPGSALVVTTSSSPLPPIAPGTAPPPLVVTQLATPLDNPQDIYFKDEDRDIEAMMHQLSWLEPLPTLPLPPAAGGLPNGGASSSLAPPGPRALLGGALSRSIDCLLPAQGGSVLGGGGLVGGVEPIMSRLTNSMSNVLQGVEAAAARLERVNTHSTSFSQYFLVEYYPNLFSSILAFFPIYKLKPSDNTKIKCTHTFPLKICPIFFTLLCQCRPIF